MRTRFAAHSKLLRLRRIAASVILGSTRCQRVLFGSLPKSSVVIRSRSLVATGLAVVGKLLTTAGWQPAGSLRSPNLKSPAPTADLLMPFGLSRERAWITTMILNSQPPAPRIKRGAGGEGEEPPGKGVCALRSARTYVRRKRIEPSNRRR
jgi:hypothetical protein